MNPLSVIDPNAKIGKDVKIGNFVTIEGDVIIGDGTEIMSGAVIMNGSRIGKNCKIFQYAVIGNVPQDLKFKGEYSLAEIGDNTVIREFVTVHRGTNSRGTTKIGNNCLIMAYNHIGHDCVIGNNIIMSNACQVAGEVEIDDHAVIGGGTLIHQFSLIGGYSMIQGGTRISKDVPPYSMIGREPMRFIGLNLVGLRRRGFSTEKIGEITKLYHILYQDGLNMKQALAKAEEEIPESEEKQYVINFIKKSNRGIANNK